MQEEAGRILRSSDLTSRPGLVLFSPNWHQGLVGLIASRVKEKVHRPVLAFAPIGRGLLRGSGRSIEGLHLRDALDFIAQSEPGIIVKFGGHALAAGLTIREDRLDDFRKSFEAVVQERLSPDALTEDILVDGALSPEEISFSLIREIDSVVWGQSFEAPLFANEFEVVRQQPLKGGEHLRARVSTGGETYEAVFFRRTSPLPGRVRLAYHPDVNEWMGRRTLQLTIEHAEE